MIDTLISLENTQCPACNSSALKYEPSASSIGIHLDGIRCHACDRSYDLIHGLPYLGTFFSDDVLGLIEISANTDRAEILLSDEVPQKKAVKSDRDFIFWIDLLDAYTHALNKNQILAERGISEKPGWFENRYREHLVFKTLTNGVSLKGKSVLDIGAGSGFDSLKFHVYGADVTCLEFSPLLCLQGKFDYPQLHWYGGSSRNLPFPDNHFDIVVATAALHHLSDIPQSLQESLRVLKPGGYLLTMSDPFRANHLSEEVEAIIFNDHPDVLRGINEQVPIFSNFVQVFEQHSSDLDIRVFTNFVNEVSPFPREWTFDEAVKSLSSANGDVNFQVRKREDIKLPNTSLPQGDVQPGLYTEHLQNQVLGISWLVNFIPKQYLNLPLLSNKFPKFRLLNGWKLQKDDEDFRVVYKRSRLFFKTEDISPRSLQFEFLIPYISDCDDPSITILINSKRIYSDHFVRGVWHHRSIPLTIDDIALEGCQCTFFVEVVLETRHWTTEANLFRVRELTLSPEYNEIQPEVDVTSLDTYGIETLMKTTFKDVDSLTALVSSDLDHVMNVVSRISQFQVSLGLIVPAEQRQFYSWMPNCHIHSTYSLKDNTSDGLEEKKLGAVQLLISSGTELNSLVSHRLNKNASLPYIVGHDGFCTSLSDAYHADSDVLSCPPSTNIDRTASSDILDDVDMSAGIKVDAAVRSTEHEGHQSDISEEKESNRKEVVEKTIDSTTVINVERTINPTLSENLEGECSTHSPRDIESGSIGKDSSALQNKPASEDKVKLRRLRKNLKALRDENQGLQIEIDAMKTSKFWKLRSYWFKVKGFFLIRKP